MNKPEQIELALGTKITLRVLFVSGMFTILATIIQLYLDYRRDIERIDDILSMIETSHLSSLKRDIWFMREQNVNTKLEEILQLPHIEHLDLDLDLEAMGMNSIALGDRPGPQYQAQRVYVMNRDISNGLKGAKIGRLTVIASTEETWQSLEDKIVVVLVSQGIKTFFVSFFILYLIHSLITRHLKKIASYVTNINANTKANPLMLEQAGYGLGLKRRDELDLVVSAINAMQKNLLSNVATLKNAQSYIACIIDSMPSVIIGVDTDGRVTQWNKKAQQLTGIEVKEVTGQPLSNAFPRFITEIHRIREAIDTHTEQSVPRRPYLQGDQTRYENVSIYPLISNEIEGAVIRLDDVTEKVRLEKMMVQNEKMLSVGGLAAGMAHEINNPLAGMMQTASVLKNRLTSKELPANQRAAEAAGIDMEAIYAFMEERGILRMAEDINKSGQRVADIVENMLSFARKSDAVSSSQDVGELLEKALDLAATDYDLKSQYDFKTINIVREYAEDLPCVPCEGTKIQQVLLNVLRNGAQAMQEARVENATFILRTRYDHERRAVCLEIEDNGPGMNEDTRKRVFDPFFTTKPVGVGTGLGLSVSYFIITESHGGEMRVDSEPGKGARFIIRLPLGSVEK